MNDPLLPLIAAETHSPATLRAALNAAEARVRASTPAPVADRAIQALHQGLERAGAATLAGGDPQAIEDALYAADPTAPLSEKVFRNAWLAFTDALARTGDKPPFGGSGAAESWAFTARSVPWPYVRHTAPLDQVLAAFGQGVRVVAVRGPGRSSFLAAVRRGLLARHGVLALVPPVVPAARDDVTGLLRPVLGRAPLDQQIAQALDQLRLGEDLIGVLGRAGDKEPVAFLLDDAHLQGRSVLLGLPLLVEPAPERRALVVLACPDEVGHDGPLAEVLADAKERDILLDIRLPAWDADFAADLLQARFGEVPAEWPALLAQVGVGREAVRLGEAHRWLEDLAGDRAHGAERLRAGFNPSPLLPKHVGAQRILALAAIEAVAGGDFHAFTVGGLLGKNEDYIEDLLHDDEFELDGAVVGTCEGAVAPGTLWASLPDGLHPAFSFVDPRLASALVATLEPQDLAERAGGLRDALLNKYGPAGVWQVADRIWRLDMTSKRPRQVQQLLVGTQNPARIEMGFRRMLPILQAQNPYRLALARLYGTSMEFGALAASQGKVQHADQAFQAAAASAQRLKRPGPAGEALARLAEVRLAVALPRPAVAALDVAEPLLQSGGHTASLARLLLLRAEARVLEGDLRGAEVLLRTGVKRLKETHDRGHEALGLMRLGRVLFELGDEDAGLTALDESIHVADASNDPRAAAAARLGRAHLFAEQNQLEPAFKLLNEAAAAFQAVGMPVHVVEVAAADLQRRHGNAAGAEKRLRAVADAFKQAQAAVQWADAWHGVARCLLDLDKPTEAAAALIEVIELRKRARDRFALVRVYEELGQALTRQGDFVRAYLELSHARRFAERLGMSRRLGRIDADLAKLTSALDGLADLSAADLRARAASAIDELEALWAAPPQPAASAEVH